MAGNGGLCIGVLGPLSGTRGGIAVRLPGGRAGVLLAVLAMSAGNPVGTGRLAELVWPEDRPERVRASLQTLAARLRAVLPGVVVTAGDGYLLELDPDQVDLLRFRGLVRAAERAGDNAGALGLLDQALGLWRGEPLAGLRSSALDREVVPGLVDEHLAAMQRRAGLELAAGRHDRVIAELRALAGRYRLREPLWGLLLRALADAGRPAEAIGEYHRARQILAEELGVDPSPELQDLYQQLLRAGGEVPHPRSAVPPGEPVPGGVARPGDRPGQGGVARPGDGPRGRTPRRLPAEARVFTGRQAELSRLLGLDDGPAEAAGGAAGARGPGPGPGPGTVVISVIDGMAGVGKTALAVRAAHRLAGRFGDGQLFIDLHGYTRGYPPRTADQALATLLRTLGVPAQQIPEDAEERAALYRERLAGTRTLIVLDNAVDEAQIRPLIPGGTGCMVLVTSRRKLKGLDDAHTMALDVLPEPDAIALFAALAGPGRARPDDPAVAEIVRLCGRLPLAVRIAAALLRNRPAWGPGYLAGKLRAVHTRLDALSDGDRDLAAVFGLSGQALTRDQRRLYRHLGLAPGPEADAYAAAALLNTDPATAERLLQELVDHSLLFEPTVGRYQMHDLIRSHSRVLATRDPAAEREAALGRLLDYYQHTAWRADARVARYAQPGPGGRIPSYAPELPDVDAARAWLRAERANLTACLEYAIQGGRDDRTVALSAGLTSLLRTDGPWAQAMALHTAAAAAAERLGDRSGQARAATELGDLRRLTGDYRGAGQDLQAALKLYRETGDKPGQARALTDLGTVRRVSSDYPGADSSLRAALELWGETADKSGRARALTELGNISYASGDYGRGERHLRAALALYRDVGNKSGQARTLSELAEIQRLTGDCEGATRNTAAALAISEELGDRLGQANALSLLGRVRCLTGDYQGAARHQQAALDLYRELGDPLGQANARMLLAEVWRLTGDHERAARDLEESISVYQDLGNRGNETYALNQYAAVVSATGDLPRAVALYHYALHLAREIQQPDDEAAALEGLGETRLREGRLHDGAVYLHQALQIYRRLGMPAAEQVTERLAEIGSLDLRLLLIWRSV
jgi:DNA-binding SARP family transcriptional activator